MKIEAIQPQDIPELVEMARQAHQESKYRHLPFSPKSVEQTFVEHCNSPNHIAVKVVSDSIAGFFLGCMAGMVFTDTPIGMETSYYVRPEYRGSRCFLLLIRAFQAWCKEKSLTPFLLPHFAEDNSKTFSALEKLGFKCVGRFYSGEF